MGNDGNYTDGSFTDLLKGYDDVKDVEVEQVYDPEVFKEKELPEDAPERRRGVRRNVETPIQASKIDWNVEYDDTKYKVIKILKRLAIVLGILLVVGLGVFVVYPRVKNGPARTDDSALDISKYSGLTEAELSQKLDLDFQKEVVFSKETPIYNDQYVSCNSADNFSVFYIEKHQSGIYFSNSGFKMYGLKIGGKEEDTFDKVDFKYTKTYKFEKELSTGKRTIYYFCNTDTSECLVACIDNKDYKIKELGYFYDYKEILKDAL